MPYYWAKRNTRLPEERALNFSYAFLGVRLDCAQCHKHPMDEWTQADYRAFANVFSQVQLGSSPDIKAAVLKEQTERQKAIKEALDAIDRDLKPKKIEIEAKFDAELALQRKQREELLRQTPRGLYVTNLMGFGFNPVTGDFSRGAQGFWIEDGEHYTRIHEVRGHTALEQREELDETEITALIGMSANHRDKESGGGGLKTTYRADAQTQPKTLKKEGGDAAASAGRRSAPVAPRTAQAASRSPQAAPSLPRTQLSSPEAEPRRTEAAPRSPQAAPAPGCSPRVRRWTRRDPARSAAAASRRTRRNPSAQAPPTRPQARAFARLEEQGACRARPREGSRARTAD